MATRRRRRDIERFGPWRASSKLPTEQRPIKYTAGSLQAAREAASMTIEEVADLCGYSPGTIAQMERGVPFHTVSISRASSAIEGHNLAEIRDEGS